MIGNTVSRHVANVQKHVQQLPRVRQQHLRPNLVLGENMQKGLEEIQPLNK